VNGRAFAGAAALALTFALSRQGHGADAPPSLRSRVGIEVAARLMRSGDPDERLRGIERAAAIGTPESLTLLVRAAGPSLQGGPPDAHPPLDGVARQDMRALLAVVRGLARSVNAASAREALAAILAAPTQSFATRAPASSATHDPSRDEPEGLARLLLARQEAAIALDRSGSTLALESLVATARSGGTGQEPALLALAVEPPAGPLTLGGVALTTRSTVTLAARLGDLRTLSAILGIVGASDAGLRAAVIEALGIAGDTRVLEVARASVHDEDPRVRLAAASALVHLGAPEAGAAVEAGVTDEAIALEALGLAREVQTEGVTRAAAALAAASGDHALQGAALAALGRQTTPLSVRALLTLAEQPALEGDAAYAIARSPSAAALGGLEEMAATSGRLAARAYLVRRFIRGERSARLDALLHRLAASRDARDRAVGTQALVALGEASLEQALADRDAPVRRAAAMAGMTAGHARSTAALLARLAVEPDVTTRRVLALGLADGDPGGTMPTSALIERSQSGGPDAPMAALAVARRAQSAVDPIVSGLLTSTDRVLRAHAARGLGLGTAPDAPGRLEEAYSFETDLGVRRAVVVALSARGKEGATTLALAAELDPDPVIRAVARGTLEGASAAAPPLVREVAWMRVVPAAGAVLPSETTGVLVQSDGLAVPIAFDEDGYALVPGVPPGEGQLRLAPSLPAYLAPSP
jgi:HEAT repeat protein